MRDVLLVPLLGLLISCGQPSAAPPAETAEATHTALLARIDQFNSAIREGDKDKYGDVFTDDFVFAWSRNGQIYDRESILPNVVPTPDYTPLVDEHLVRVHGDAAIVNYRVRKAPDDDGVRVTFSYARIADEWKVIASHSTAIVVEEEEADDDAE